MNGELEIIKQNGQPYGIRDKGGFLLFFPRVEQYPGQMERYVKEVTELFDLSRTIKKAIEAERGE